MTDAWFVASNPESKTSVQWHSCSCTISRISPPNQWSMFSSSGFWCRLSLLDFWRPSPGCWSLGSQWFAVSPLLFFTRPDARVIGRNQHAKRLGGGISFPRIYPLTPKVIRKWETWNAYVPSEPKVYKFAVLWWKDRLLSIIIFQKQVVFLPKVRVFLKIAENLMFPWFWKWS